MAQQIAITIGINHYEHERSLECAENDAVAMEAYLQEIGFEVLRYSDTSPRRQDKSTVPELTNLLTAIDRIASKVRLGPDDSFWFFFSGHGGRQGSRDFLLPSNGHPDFLNRTAISVEEIIHALTKCGAGNLIFILDACRNDVPQRSKGIGSQTAELARQAGVITLFSCSPGEKSYELPDLRQGIFTHVLLEALRGICAPTRCNPHVLSQYLRNRVPQLSQQYGSQVPYVVAEPIEKAIQVLLPSETRSNCSQSSNPTINIDQLIANAERAIRQMELDRAEKLWWQINRIATEPEDRGLAVEKLLEIAALKQAQTKAQTADTITTDSNISMSEQACPIPETFTPSDSQRYIPPSAETWDADRRLNIIDEIDLDSQVEGIDYIRLKRLLSQGNWKAAKQETVDLLIEVIDKPSWTDVDEEDIRGLPCKDLRVIDSLWTHFSEGRFGFSPQRKIWQECGCSRNIGYDPSWNEFCDEIGWRKKNDVFNIDDFFKGFGKSETMMFALSANIGHLPKIVGSEGLSSSLGSLFYYKVETCNI